MTWLAILATAAVAGAMAYLGLQFLLLGLARPLDRDAVVFRALSLVSATAFGEYALLGAEVTDLAEAVLIGPVLGLFVLLVSPRETRGGVVTAAVLAALGVAGGVLRVMLPPDAGVWSALALGVATGGAVLYGLWVAPAHARAALEGVWRSRALMGGLFAVLPLWGWFVVDGRALWVHVGAAVFVAAVGALLSFGLMRRGRDARRLDVARERLWAMLDAAPEAITIFDADRGTYELANRKALEMFGIPRTAVTTVRPADLRPPRQPDGRDSDELIRANVERALAGETVSFEWTAVRYDDGRPVPCEVRLVRFPAEGRNLVRVSVVGIGERLAQRERERELSAQLQHARRLEAVGTFTGGVAHDFNNLLQVIRGNLELLQMEVRGDPDAYSLVDASMYAADRGAVLTRELLAFARQQPLAPVTIDLRSEMDDLTLLIARTMGEELALRVDVPEDVWLLHADRAQLQNALLNLALNAHEAMPGGGTLRITAENATVDVGDRRSADMGPGDYVAIAVSDEGTGMDADVLPHIFEPFWTTKDVGEGSGLGLSMVHGFAGQSGGFVTVRSAVGRGTTVRIFLPRRIPVA